MYLFPLELLIAAIAWRKGLRWRALIPTACAFAISFTLAIAFFAIGRAHIADMEELKDILSILVILIHACAIGFLGKMMRRLPRTQVAAATAPQTLL